MKHRLSMQELVVVAGSVVLGCFLRFAAIDQLAVEHFDEGIYSSTVWYDQLNGESYPARHLYAPPALPTAIEAASSFVDSGLAPFIPSLLSGALTILIVWGFTRAAFGMVAGLMVVLLASLSDFHILYSRMALTDVPALMWIVLAVWLGVTGIDRQSGKTMLFAGIACGCAWWTKYTGWLPVAIISSGSLFWWTIGGRRQCGLWRLVGLNGIMAACAFAVWSPWLWVLSGVGGYRVVAANHDAYRMGWSSWSGNLTTQITWYAFTDSWLQAVAIVLGVTFAGSHRWFEARRSTWNQLAPQGTGITPLLLGRFIAAAVVLCIATLSIGSFGVLTALGAAGIAGMFLWPAIRLQRHDSANENSSGSGKATSDSQFDLTDFHASPELDPLLAACVVAAWFCGLLLNLPTYTPFPRLLLPLLAVIWIAAAAGIGWWVEANISVARRSAGSGNQSQTSALQVVVLGLVLASLFLSAWKLDLRDVARSGIHDTRLGLRDASNEVAAMCRKAAGVKESARADPAGPPQCIVYAFGEPAVLYQLSLAGVVGMPVQDLLFAPATASSGRRLPTFLLFGPNALRTNGFMYDWADHEHRFEHVGDVSYEPSAIALYNLFRPQWIIQHPGDERQQRLEVYRLR